MTSSGRDRLRQGALHWALCTGHWALGIEQDGSVQPAGPPLCSSAPLRSLRFAVLCTLCCLCVLSGGCVLLPTLKGPPPALEDRPPRTPPQWSDIRGIVHCHSSLSHDSEGKIERIAATARDEGVGFVAMTDHFTPRSVTEGARGLRDGVLFLVGVELSRDHGSILGLGVGDASPVATPTAGAEVLDFGDTGQEAIDRIHGAGGLAFVGHAEDFNGWAARGWDGVEVHNLHADASRQRWWTYLWAGLFTPPGCFFTRLIDDPRDVLARWDLLGKTRRVPGVGGCDCHANVSLFGPLGGTIGTYAECFRAVTTHVLIRYDFSAAAVCEALREGRCYIAFEINGDAGGFTFELSPGAVPMGAEVPFRAGLRLDAHAPGADRVRLVLRRDGVQELEAAGGDLTFDVRAPGTYRVEAYLDGNPFVISNPIYVR